MTLRDLRVLRGLFGLFFVLFAAMASAAQAQPLPPELTQPVNDFAGVVDDASERSMESLIRSLEQASGDVVVVATVDSVAPYADIREYAVKMFENHGKGIGKRGRDNGLLVLLSVKDRRVWVEVGYDLEQFITDGYAGETSRRYMVPEFSRGNYGAGLVAGVSRIIGRIAEARNVSLQGVRPEPRERRDSRSGGGGWFLVLFLLFIIFSSVAGRTRGRRPRYWGGNTWSGWHSGVGPFGGGGGGGFIRGGGFGGGFGGFGGFGGGRSGGGGGGGSW